MIEIITGRDAALCEWAGRRLGIELRGDYPALGFAEGPELLAAVVYHDHVWPNIEASIFAASPRWCCRRTLFACFHYPFVSQRCRRFGARTAITNQPIRGFLGRLGFTLEGIARQALRDPEHPEQNEVVDVCIYGMLAEECRWLGRLGPPPAAQTAD